MAKEVFLVLSKGNFSSIPPSFLILFSSICIFSFFIFFTYPVTFFPPFFPSWKLVFSPFPATFSSPVYFPFLKFRRRVFLFVLVSPFPHASSFLFSSHLFLPVLLTTSDHSLISFSSFLPSLPLSSFFPPLSILLDLFYGPNKKKKNQNTASVSLHQVTLFGFYLSYFFLLDSLLHRSILPSLHLSLHFPCSLVGYNAGSQPALQTDGPLIRCASALPPLPAARFLIKLKLKEEERERQRDIN